MKSKNIAGVSETDRSHRIICSLNTPTFSYQLYDVRYKMIINGGGDIWCLEGKCIDHPRFADGMIVTPSSPISLDKENLILSTHSGSKIKLLTFNCDRDKCIEQIQKDIANKGYEIL